MSAIGRRDHRAKSVVARAPRAHARASCRSRSSGAREECSRPGSAARSARSPGCADGARCPCPARRGRGNATRRTGWGRSPTRLIDFRNCFGMIESVSTLARSSGATSPVMQAKRFHRSACPYRARRTSTKWPAIAAAAAIAGLTRCVRPPAPCRPSKLRFDVDAQRSPGSSRSSFIARHIEQPGSRQSKPASRKHAGPVPRARPAPSRAPNRAPPARASRTTPRDGRAPRQAAARRSSIRELVHEPMNTLSIPMSVIAVFGVEPHVGERPLDAVAPDRRPFLVGVGHAAVDRDDHFRRRAPRDLRAERRGVEHHDGVEARARRR